MIFQTRIDPPKPEREPSQRKRRQKELNEDFIDISSQRAFSAIVLQSKKKPAKKPQISPKKETSSLGTAKTTTSAASKDGQKTPTKKSKASEIKRSSNQSPDKHSKAKTAIAKVNKKQPSKPKSDTKALTKSPTKKAVTADKKSEKSEKNGSTSPKKKDSKLSDGSKVKSVKKTTKKVGETDDKEPKSRSIKLKLPAPPTPLATDYDLTDRDSVRQLLSNRNTKLPSPPAGSSLQQLNSALTDALTG